MFIYAAASDNIATAYMDSVEQLGECLACKGHDLIYGGGGSGLMGAAARGFRKKGGEVIGVSPRFMRNFEPIFEDCTETIITDDMSDRKLIMENNCEAFIIVPGGIGTFDEFFQVLTLKTLGKMDKPIIVYNLNGYYSELLVYLDKCAKEGFVREDIREFFAVANSINEVMESL